MAERPGNVVDEDVLSTEENGRSEDSIRKPRLPEVSLQARSSLSAMYRPE
jgi:hypothetical protein